MSFLSDIAPVIGTIGGAALGGPAGAAIGGSLGNAIASNQANQDTQAQNERMWRLNNEYNTPLNQRKRLREAGYSEALFYGNGTVGNSSSPAAPFERKVPQLQPEMMGTVANSVADLKLKASQSQNLEANARLADVQANKLGGVDTVKQQIENDFNKVTFNDRVSTVEQQKLLAVKENAIKAVTLENLDVTMKGQIQELSAKVAEAYQNIKLSEANVSKIAKEKEKMDSEIGLIKSETNKTNLEAIGQAIRNDIENIEKTMRERGTSIHDMAPVRGFILAIQNAMQYFGGSVNH